MKHTYGYRSMRKNLQIIVAAAILFISLPLLADTVHLKNGNTLKGRILSQNDKEIEIQVGHTGIVTVARDDVADVEIDDNYGALNEPPTQGEAEVTEKEETLENMGESMETFSGFLLGLSFGLLVFSVVIVIPIVSFCLWLAIKIVDSQNGRNRFFMAVGFMIILTIASLVTGLFLPLLAGLVMDILLLMIVLLAYYKLTFFRALAAFIITIVLEFFGVLLALLILFSIVR